MVLSSPASKHYTGSRSTVARQPFDLEELYRRYGDLVVGRCRSLLRNDADAQEVAQEVFLRVWRYRDTFRGEASPSTYLFKVTTTTCLNRLRTRRRHPEELVDDFALSPAAELGGGDTLLGGLETRQLLDLLLAEEDDGTVDAVVYHYVDGMTHDEAGELLGVSGAAVRKRIATFKERARARLSWLETP